MRVKAVIAMYLGLGNLVFADWDGRDGHLNRKACISDKEAALLVSNFESLFVNIKPDLATRILADDFAEYSDSLNWISPPGTGNYTVSISAHTNRQLY